MTNQEFVKDMIRNFRLNGIPVHNAKAVRNLSWVHRQINRRATIKQTIEKYNSEGEIGYSWYSVDCDMCSSQGEKNITTPSVSDWIKFVEDKQDWAEGIEHHVLGPIVEEEINEHKDLTLEAFEDGHAHVVYI